MKSPSELFDEGLSEIFTAVAKLPEDQRKKAIQVAVEKMTVAFRTVEKSGAIDPLTGLPNRAGLNLDLLGRLESMKRHKDKNLAVVFIDLDNFKAVNDGLGHKTGDDALKQAASRLKNAFRGTDTVGRLGGDEMLIVLSNEPGVDFSEDDIREKVRGALDGLVFWRGSDPVPVCSSIGISFLTGADAQAFERSLDKLSEDLIAEADAHMYVDKKAGRDERIAAAVEKALETRRAAGKTARPS